MGCAKDECATEREYTSPTTGIAFTTIRRKPGKNAREFLTPAPDACAGEAGVDGGAVLCVYDRTIFRVNSGTIIRVYPVAYIHVDDRKTAALQAAGLYHVDGVL